MPLATRIALHSIIGVVEYLIRQHDDHLPLGVRDALHNVLDVIDKEAWS